MGVSLRLTGQQHALLWSHLFPGDGKEAVAILLCGRRDGGGRHCLTTSKIFPISYEQCHYRGPHRVTWSTGSVVPILEEASRRGMAVVKVHSHLEENPTFSVIDDQSDNKFFPSVFGWMDDELPHGSTVMLPNGRLFGRAVDCDGGFEPLESICIAGDDIYFWYQDFDALTQPGFVKTHTQAFGKRTVDLLRRLSIAVVGCSGTGAPLVEQLARLGVMKLVLVDPDVIDEKNLNRIPNATIDDGLQNTPKVYVQERAIQRMGLGTEVVAIPKNLFDSETIKIVAGCDVLFGCMDSVDGRHLLNKIATFYLIPYFDLGVKLIADSKGSIDHACGTVHYLQPDRSSLLSRRVYTLEQVRAAALKRTDPEVYEEQKRAKYIEGVDEERPAVISVNTLISSMGVLEFLARIHGFRDDENGEFAIHRISLNQGQIYKESEGTRCNVLSRYVGIGDIRPLLGMPVLSEMEVAPV